MKECDPKLFSDVFQRIGHQWMLISATADGESNAMTASWGGLGVLWNKNVVFCFVRPQRYTKELLDASPTFGLSFLPESHRKTLNYFGTVSGRNENKIEHSGLTFAHSTEGIPYFKESDFAVLCKKIYIGHLNEECFLDPKLSMKFYTEKDFHDVYIGEIIRVLTKD